MSISDKEIAELQRRRQELLYGTPEDQKEPIHEPEDIGCDCTEAGIESEWDWHPDQGVYVCNGCGEVQ